MNYIEYKFPLKNIYIYDENYDFTNFPIELFSNDKMTISLSNYGFKTDDLHHRMIINSLDETYKIKIDKPTSFIATSCIKIQIPFDELNQNELPDENNCVKITNHNSLWISTIKDAINCINSISKNLIKTNNLICANLFVKLSHDNISNLNNYFDCIKYKDLIYGYIEFEENIHLDNLNFNLNDIMVNVSNIKLAITDKSTLFHEYIAMSWKYFENNNIRNAIIELDIAIDIISKEIMGKLSLKLNEDISQFNDKMLDGLTVGECLKALEILLPDGKIKYLREIHDLRNLIIHKRQRKISENHIHKYKIAIRSIQELYKKFI